MARYREKSKAIELRKKGYSYSQIKEKIGVSKSTLSGWLRNYPLSDKKIRELTADSPRRIERYVNTMRKKREEKFSVAYEKVKKDIGIITERELFIAGFFLYWAEGGKTTYNTITLTNTDPSMLKAYLKWLKIMRVSRSELKIKLHLYMDMDEKKEIDFWSRELGVKKFQFNKTWIKDSKMSNLTYKNNFGHGTCNIILNNTAVALHVLMGIKFIGTVVASGNTSKMRA